MGGCCGCAGAGGREILRSLRKYKYHYSIQIVNVVILRRLGSSVHCCGLRNVPGQFRNKPVSHTMY